MEELYKGITGSPITYLTSDITASQTTIAIADGTALPDAPNICTIGYGENLETIKYEVKSNGVLQEVTRGIEGTPQAWQAGTEVARFFTAYDHYRIVDEITSTKEDLSSHMAESAKKHIHSSGSNTNGRWIKYDDGTMVVSISVLTKDVTIASRKENGLNGYYADIDINFPQNFKKPPSLSPSGRLQKLRDGSTVNCVFSGVNNLTISNNKATIRAWSILEFDSVTYFTLTAVGPWK